MKDQNIVDSNNTAKTSSTAKTPKPKHKYSIFPETTGPKDQAAPLAPKEASGSGTSNVPHAVRVEKKTPRSPVVLETTSDQFLRLLRESRVQCEAPAEPATPTAVPLSSPLAR